MRIEAGNAHATAAYQIHPVGKRLPDCFQKDAFFREILNDESKKLKGVFYSADEFNPVNFKGPYITPEIPPEALNAENSIILVPGTVISMGVYSGKELTLRVGGSYVGMHWDSEPIGSEHVKKVNDMIRRFLNGVVDENGIPDISKLTRSQVAALNRIEREHHSVVMKLGGPKQYEHIRRAGEALDALIRVANGQMPGAALSPDTHLQIRAALEMAGIDTSKPFYVNGRKFYFTAGGGLRFAE
ncbi:MAG TPA: hypothetical protein PK127_01170 [Clostridiales bacterium]|nr:hypothetical protein [Clostridiales bacterium]HPV01080.1 hypothetical protein [Clostridiales bacterium]